ncbi:hypothetical protein [Spirochaeta lutea]|uniref:SF4 helicase domain-containing protein n=1 Tax=Spirochaeta lutea TaxID=1480694 RepID=A0A098QWU5_9SPIO|nr:hypothetical protein [Spirochaeta lutea]KGE71853.1 hypothetical protein DC28_08480 [Spirochaeta lutea]
MVKAELVKRSPLRIMEKSTRGGVEAGNIGVIASPRGVGKTACLVHIATDKLLQGKHVIHLSFAAKTDHIIDWYEAVYKEIATNRNLESAVEVHDELVKNRVILNFNQHDVTIDQIEKSIEALISEGHFAADLLVIDGYDFDKGSVGTFEALKGFAAKHNLTVWATADIEKNTGGIPKELSNFEQVLSVLIDLEDEKNHIKLNLRKDHDRIVDEDLHLILDSKTLLIAEE